MEQKYEQFKSKQPENGWPINSIFLTNQEKIENICSDIIRDIKRGKKIEENPFKDYWENYAPTSKVLKDLREEFQLKIPQEREINRLRLQEILNYFEKQHLISPDHGDNLKENLEQRGINSEGKVAFSHIVKLLVYLGYLDITYLRETISLFKKRKLTQIFPFWEGLAFAYEYTVIYDKMFYPPLFILNPRTKRERLEDLLIQRPDLILPNKSSFYSDQTKGELDKPLFEDGRNVGTLLDTLLEYPGTYKDNRVAWELYERIMGSQGSLNEIMPPGDNRPFHRRVGFVHFLVEFTSCIDQKEKYSLADDFLTLYLGVDLIGGQLTPDTIKAHLKPRK